MTASKARAVAAAFLLGTATVCGAAMIFAGPAEAASVRPEVGTLLKEAQSLAAAGNYKAAMEKVNQANAVSNKDADETSIIAQMKQYIAVKSGDVSIGGAAAGKAKFTNDYNARKYSDVIADGELLKKSGALDVASQQVVAQAYYLSGDKKGCVKYIKTNFGTSASDPTLELLVRCAYDANDDDSQRQALEPLIAHTGKPEYWNSLLKLSEHGQGMRDHDSLDIYRLKLLTGTISGKDEYITLAQLAIQLGFPAEAQAVIEKGQAAKILNDDRTNRLLARAKSDAAADAAGLSKSLATANAAPKGDGLVKIGEDQWGQNKAKDAIETIKAGMAKPLDDKTNAQIRLGMAYIAAGQKADAQKTLDAVKGAPGDKGAMIAHLWGLYARH